MKRRTILLLAAAIPVSAGIAACQGLKDAFTAHVDVAATAGAQELSVERLAALLQNVQVPVTADIAKAIANIWVDYQLLGEAAAKNDTLNDPKMVDSALWALLAQQRAGKFHEVIVKSYPGVDTAGLAATYPTSDFLSAQHILFVVPPTASPAQKDSVRRFATKIRAELTAANFAVMAEKYSGDPGSAKQGGQLPVFRRGQMVPQFDSAVRALPPGAISGIVQTQFGYHIIRRNTYAEARQQFAQAVGGPAIERADSIYMSGLEASGHIKLAPNAAQTVKTVVGDLDAHAGDKTVLATWIGGDFTVSRLVRWLSAAPSKEQMADQVRQMPDSSVDQILKQVLRNELVLRAADSAKIVLDSAELVALHARYTSAVVNIWSGLGVSPASLADSGKTVPAREKIAAARADAFLDRLMKQEAQYVPVAPPIQQVARAKYGAKLSTAGLQRAVDMAVKQKAAADSARAKARPATEVPIGGAPPAPSAPPAEKKPR